MPISTIRSIYLTDDGIIGGTADAAVDGTTPVPYYFQPSLNSMGTFVVTRMLVTIEDNASITSANYGAVSTLTNGVRVQHVSDGVTTDLDGGLGIKSNIHWARLCYDFSINSFGAGNNFVTVRWTFERAGKPLILESADQLKVTVQDNLSTLESQFFLIQGYEK